MNRLVASALAAAALVAGAATVTGCAGSGSDPLPPATIDAPATTVVGPSAGPVVTDDSLSFGDPGVPEPAHDDGDGHATPTSVAVDAELTQRLRDAGTIGDQEVAGYADSDHIVIYDATTTTTAG